MFKQVLEKAEEPEIKLPAYTGSLEKEEISRKTCTSALLILILSTDNSLSQPLFIAYIFHQIFHMPLKEGQCQTMFKLPHHSAHFTR